MEQVLLNVNKIACRVLGELAYALTRRIATKSQLIDWAERLESAAQLLRNQANA